MPSIPDYGTVVASDSVQYLSQFFTSMSELHTEMLKRFLVGIRQATAWGERYAKTEAEREQWKKIKDECEEMDKKMGDVHKDADVSLDTKMKGKAFAMPIQMRNDKMSEEYGQDVVKILDQQGIPASFVHGFPSHKKGSKEVNDSEVEKERKGTPYGYVCTALKRKQDVLDACTAVDIKNKDITITTSLHAFSLATDYDQLIEVGGSGSLTDIQFEQFRREQKEWNKTFKDKQIPLCFTNDKKIYCRQEDADIFKVLQYRTKERLEGRCALDLAKQIGGDQTLESKIKDGVMSKEGCVLCDAEQPDHVYVCSSKGFREYKNGVQLMNIRDPRTLPQFVSIPKEQQKEAAMQYISLRHQKIQGIHDSVVILPPETEKKARAGYLTNMKKEMEKQRTQWGILPSLTPDQMREGKLSDYWQAYQDVLNANELPEGEFRDFVISQSNNIVQEYAAPQNLSNEAAVEKLSNRFIHTILGSKAAEEDLRHDEIRPDRFTREELKEGYDVTEEDIRKAAGLVEDNDALLEPEYVDIKEFKNQYIDETPDRDLPDLEQDFDVVKDEENEL